jgi:hypothetical protein
MLLNRFSAESVHFFFLKPVMGGEWHILHISEA